MSVLKVSSNFDAQYLKKEIGGKHNIYILLNTLIKESLIRREKRTDNKYGYFITDKGRQELKKPYYLICKICQKKPASCDTKNRPFFFCYTSIIYDETKNIKEVNMLEREAIKLFKQNKLQARGKYDVELPADTSCLDSIHQAVLERKEELKKGE